MLTDTAHGPTDAVKFVLRGLAASLGFFGLLRLNWTEANVVLPLTHAQGGLAVGLFGTPALPVEATLACSGADALALCLGAVLAYPVPRRARVAGAGGGAALILGLNTLRIGSLGRVAASPAWFNALHLYVWPVVLTIAIAGYVFAWMRLADRQAPPSPLAPVRQTSPLPSVRRAPQPSRRFVVLTVAFLLLFLAASPLYLESPSVFALAGFIARAAAVTLGVVGVSTHAAANVLWTSRGGFLVTQECISTPLIPVYLAAICAYSTTWRRLILGVLATLPLFIALGIVRLLVVALPDVVVSPIFFVHAFYQLLLGAVVVFFAALWRHGRSTALGHALVGIIVGVLFVHLLGPFYTRVVTYPAGARLDDPQGAIALLPAFQVGLYLAMWVAALHHRLPAKLRLKPTRTKAPRRTFAVVGFLGCPATRGLRQLPRRTSRTCFNHHHPGLGRCLVAVGWKRFLTGFVLLQLTQTAGLLALHALASHSGLTAHVRDVRGWAVAGPVLIFAAVVNVARSR